jgi:hypothetical protein
MNTAATQEVSCPKCGSAAMFYCETPSGHKALTPHVERTRALTKVADMTRFQIRAMTVGDIMGAILK